MKQFDSDDMYHKIINLPEQILKSYFEPKIHNPLNFSKLELKNIDKVIICGMGGSAISGDIAKVAFGTKLPFEVVKDYKIPFLNENTLVIILSYSGNTEETVTCLQQSISKTEFVGAITSGGRIKEIVDENYCWLELFPGLPPRSVIGYLFFS
ncbi:MAG: SIS domain-containing protein, partial [Candidatus Cloacimonetes bacterium]|nr:SIS domain-containing protein [Candidatus Cloacimonadota bacterium]